MVKKKFLLLLLILGLISASCGQVNQTQASTFGGEQALSLAEKAFHTQVSLSEKPQSKQKVVDSLTQYFTKEMTNSFIKENVYQVDGGYQTFGSDFASYYIPFFQYDESTHVKKADGKWYIWEERSGDEKGPVATVPGVEVVVLSEEEGTWKVTSITYELPENIQSGE
ncbi:DUF3993 domain-containing protein [Rossellomorea aquimaris]|uniref:DUF3993 domain-containing protein n=1 Tax=Rossellomorea aquimaris TaxID=189382 RepID=UPI0007D0A65C|nr:DUF3993 domain-containing protein [Rossellomorea aquimaris]